MKSLKDSFCQAITAFICFVINLLSGKSGRREEGLLTASVCGNSGNLSGNNESNVENGYVSEHLIKERENGKYINQASAERFGKQKALQKKRVEARASTQKELCKIRVPCFEENGGPPP